MKETKTIISEELSGTLFNTYGRELNKGDILFQEDDLADEVYIILTGKIKVAKHIKTGKFSYEKILVTVSEGEILGEMALFMPNSKRTASAYVVEDTKLLVLDRSTFYAMIRYNAEFSLKLMERISGYVIRTNKELEELGIAQKKLLVIEEILNKIENNKNYIKLSNIIESKNLLNQIEIDIIEKILTQLEKLEVIKIEEENINIINKNILNKFKTLLMENP
ncbi:MAG: cyclic nucleotide-binding domain-containing protein [Spirochaetota bacterium]